MLMLSARTEEFKCHTNTFKHKNESRCVMIVMTHYAIIRLNKNVYNDLAPASVNGGCDITNCRSFLLINDILMRFMTFKKEDGSNLCLHHRFES